LGQLVMDNREARKHIDVLQQWLLLMDRYNTIHSNFNVNGTRTGRLSSSKPNVQNLPGMIRSRETQSSYSGQSGAMREEEYNLRKAFLAREGHSLVSVDYKQQEMRMFGILARDPHMLPALEHGADIHADIAERIWGLRDEVHREWAKTISFGLIYGMSTGSLQFRLNMPREKSLEVAERYWRTFPRIKPWLQEVIEECKLHGYVTYWSGRRWYEESEMRMYRAANAQIQGGAHDMMMVSFNRVCRYLRKKYPEVKPVNSVHDEIVYDMPDELIQEVVPKIQKIAEVPDLFGIPFFTDVKVGKDFGTLTKVKLST
jgi:DNA polymerase-1